MFLNFREVTLVDLKTLSSVFSTRVAPPEKKIRQILRLLGAIKGHLSSETIKNLSFLKIFGQKMKLFQIFVQLFGLSSAVYKEVTDFCGSNLHELYNTDPTKIIYM